MSPITVLVVKDLRVTVRAPLFALISVLVPVAFTLLYAIVIHVSTTSTIAVADEDQSSTSRELIRVMAAMHTDDGHYYEIRTTDAPRARDMYASGDVGALLTIPPGFGDAVASNNEPLVTLHLVNINADGTKNQHIRLEEALREFAPAQPSESGPRLRITEHSVLDRDIPITVYLGSALMVFGALYAGIVNAGVAVAREWEDRTAKSLVLSPAGPRALVTGKWLSSLSTSLLTVTVAIGGIAWVLDYPVQRLGALSLLALAVVWLYGAALGTLLGVTLRKSLPLIPIAVILAVGHFLVCGYESYIRGFAHGGAVEPLWQWTHWIPLSRLFDAVRFEVAQLTQPSGLVGALATSLAVALLLAGLASWRLTRSVSFSQGQ
jgi:ABC-2 type transport system permease protein